MKKELGNEWAEFIVSDNYNPETAPGKRDGKGWIMHKDLGEGEEMPEQIKAKVIAHSKSVYSGKEIITMELEYPRFIHGELMTHRMFSRNAMSSRAVPINKMIEQVDMYPAMPIHWGKNQSGMQAKEQLSALTLQSVIDSWNEAAMFAVNEATYMMQQGAHKQIVNRVLEPFQIMKTVVTATEWENFFWLRNHEDAQPEIKRLSEVMLEAKDKSSAAELTQDDWHVPYFGDGYWLKGCGIALEDALAISASCCAQVSFRKSDDSLEKAKRVYERLVVSEPVHASPFEHQARPIHAMYFGAFTPVQDQGVTHIDMEGNPWSGNFCGFVQHRQLIPNNVKKG